jgi:hypothetical protein
MLHLYTELSSTLAWTMWMESVGQSSESLLLVVGPSLWCFFSRFCHVYKTRYHEQFIGNPISLFKSSGHAWPDLNGFLHYTVYIAWLVYNYTIYKKYCMWHVDHISLICKPLTAFFKNKVMSHKYIIFFSNGGLKVTVSYNSTKNPMCFICLDIISCVKRVDYISTSQH